jgi:hypothetical protein
MIVACRRLDSDASKAQESRLDLTSEQPALDGR